jgi:uncharacterized protein involved in outer membrane biogenesis
LFVLLIVIAVAGILLLNTVVKQVVEQRLRQQTGMEAKIGQMDVGLLTPTISIENLKLYNTAEFGGSLFLDMPELHVEYDPFAIRRGELHFKLVRLNLASISLIQDKKGRMNIQALERNATKHHDRRKDAAADVKFTGIDTLNLTLGKFHMSNEASGREEDIDFAVKGQITHNIKSEGDLAGLNMLLALRAHANSTSTNSIVDLSALLGGLTSP